MMERLTIAATLLLYIAGIALLLTGSFMVHIGLGLMVVGVGVSFVAGKYLGTMLSARIRDYTFKE